ncbi:hypothetical protein HPP92_014559 [Vanilla planifolia]|uniref:Bromo domain-containing protein n=1 Tax=Vanilla planifolia TaxID=51239 RepID=A0A835USU5_VANPL|nr:hypothetical protein HPP92_014559 [Vanilla planifolia]
MRREGSGSSRKRREKKLKLVLHIPDHSENSPRHLGSSASELECEGSGQRRKRKIEAVGSDEDRSKTGRRSSLKATAHLQEASGPRTALPDKKLLLFILDRLQKKDTYGVFSEPVNPEELPDYHEVIQHPMDFGTIRKKLSQGAYRNLEQFEKDVLLISSNAMRYNAPDSIYFRQARSIQELAKKNFENLRQDSDNEPETKTILRRGRPPNKDIKGHVGRPSAELAAMDFSELTLPISGGGSHHFHALPSKSMVTAKPGMTDASVIASFALRSHESSGWISANKGSAKLLATKFGKKLQFTDDDRRNTYRQFQPYSYGCELPFFSLFDGKKKQLATVGFHMEYAYARSLARFAADLGPIGWFIAAKKIEKALPPGTKFGRGWVGDNESPQQSHFCASTSSQSSQPIASSCTIAPKSIDNHPQKVEPLCSNMSPEGKVGEDCSETLAKEPQPRTSFQAPQSTALLHVVNGFVPGHRFDLPSQSGSAMRPMRLPMSMDTLAQWQGPAKQVKLVSVQPDLNVGFQSSSSASVSRVDSQQPDLALQL